MTDTPRFDTVHLFTVTVRGCDAKQAAKVIIERIDHEEDYGFPYEIEWDTHEISKWGTFREKEAQILRMRERLEKLRDELEVTMPPEFERLDETKEAYANTGERYIVLQREGIAYALFKQRPKAIEVAKRSSRWWLWDRREGVIIDIDKDGNEGMIVKRTEKNDKV